MYDGRGDKVYLASNRCFFCPEFHSFQSLDQFLMSLEERSTMEKVEDIMLLLEKTEHVRSQLV